MYKVRETDSELKIRNFMQRSFGERGDEFPIQELQPTLSSDCDDPRRSTPAPRRTAFPHCLQVHDEL